MPQFATVYNPKTGQRKRVEVGKPGAFSGGFQLEPRQQKAPQTYEDFLNQAFQNPEYQKAQEAVTSAETALGGLTAQEPGFLQREQTRLQEADPRLQALLQQKAAAQGKLYSQPFTAREDFQNIFDPLVRERLIAQSVGNVLGQVTGLQDLVTQRQGTAKDQAQAALELLQSQIGGATAGLKATQDARDSLQKVLLDIAEKGYTSKEKEKERKQRLRDSIDEYLAKLDIDRSLGINDFKPRTSSPDKNAWKKGYNEDLRLYGDDVRTEEGDEGTLTREEVISRLSEDYPEMNPLAIAKDVYGLYTSAEERLLKSLGRY